MMIEEIKLGEDSTRQFKSKLNNADQLAKEMCALSNSAGGTIYVGVTDNGSISGLSSDEVRLYNQWISAAANEMVRPALYPLTEVTPVGEKLILQIRLSAGVSKPYCDHKGNYWVKSGSDTRNASPQELARMFQLSQQLFLDETPTAAGIERLILLKFSDFFKNRFGVEWETTGLGLPQVLRNMNLCQGDKLNMAGLLLFGKEPQVYKPLCLIRAVAFPGVDVSDVNFNDKRDCEGNLDDQFQAALTFVKNNLRRVQVGTSFNEPGRLEIDQVVLEEVLVNALLHRDYSKNAVIRLFVFADRVELVSPGSLPNHLTIENIKSGNSVIRNPLLASYGTKMLPYSGLGSGILRVLRLHPKTELINDREGEQFKVVMYR